MIYLTKRDSIYYVVIIFLRRYLRMIANAYHRTDTSRQPAAHNCTAIALTAITEIAATRRTCNRQPPAISCGTADGAYDILQRTGLAQLRLPLPNQTADPSTPAS